MDSNSVSIPSSLCRASWGKSACRASSQTARTLAFRPALYSLDCLGSLVTPTALQMMKDDYKRYLPCAILFFLHVGHLAA